MAIVLSISMVSCSDDDSADTFLERFDGTEWEVKYVDENDEMGYYKFNNDTFLPIDEWGLKGTDCYWSIEWGNSRFAIEILENSRDTFKVKETSSSGNVSVINTFTYTDNVMRLNMLADDGGNIGSSVITLTKTSTDLESLIICDY